MGFHGDLVGSNMVIDGGLPSGKLTFCYGKSQCLMGKLTLSMAIFNSKLLVYQRVSPRMG